MTLRLPFSQAKDVTDCWRHLLLGMQQYGSRDINYGNWGMSAWNWNKPLPEGQLGEDTAPFRQARPC